MRGQRSIFDQNGWLNWFWCIVKQKVFLFLFAKTHLTYDMSFRRHKLYKKTFLLRHKEWSNRRSCYFFFFALYDLISTQFSFVTGQVFWIIFACLLFMYNLWNKVRTKLAFLDEEGKVKKNKRLQLGHFNPNLEFLLFVYKY